MHCAQLNIVKLIPQSPWCAGRARRARLLGAPTSSSATKGKMPTGTSAFQESRPPRSPGPRIFLLQS